ncbi:MAG: phosphatidylglycerophosphatase A [Deltaproteobacteria bacterium]|nr:MAG: phosphatidylglycerophosphatase A [Deltaproteobacteria bacterium]
MSWNFHVNATRRNDLTVFLATGFFSGFFPVAPGTWGTFAAVPLVMLVNKGSNISQLVSAIILVLVAVWLAGRAESLLGTSDASCIVIDEMAGFVISLLWLPLSFYTLCLGFVLFRGFDIVKPPPIPTVEKRLQGGWAVVMDDVLAGVFTNITLRLLLIVAGLL